MPYARAHDGGVSLCVCVCVCVCERESVYLCVRVCESRKGGLTFSSMFNSDNIHYIVRVCGSIYRLHFS